jgi:hypothetical protein
MTGTPGGVVKEVRIADLKQAITEIQGAIGRIGELIEAHGDGERVRIGHTEMLLGKPPGWYAPNLCDNPPDPRTACEALEFLIRFLQMLCQNLRDLPGR